MGQQTSLGVLQLLFVVQPKNFFELLIIEELFQDIPVQTKKYAWLFFPAKGNTLKNIHK